MIDKVRESKLQKPIGPGSLKKPAPRLCSNCGARMVCRGISDVLVCSAGCGTTETLKK